ncbi:hypothetical protein ARMGADRAFT_1092923 [Armillaria gallica]|uniref:Uncharacterized protein n=1 Tax=Armillaria gallica TaxID=47427 RepID=A0A2H3C9A4_ARMGA|nr:hypothetical protein ARMGADRAFT_1092923 [Armillaria gallica]
MFGCVGNAVPIINLPISPDSASEDASLSDLYASSIDTRMFSPITNLSLCGNLFVYRSDAEGIFFRRLSFSRSKDDPALFDHLCSYSGLHSLFFAHREGPSPERHEKGAYSSPDFRPATTMLLPFYDQRIPPEHPYMRTSSAYSAYSALVELYARSDRLDSVHAIPTHRKHKYH